MGTSYDYEVPNALKTTAGVWTKSISLREMLGYEEDILADNKKDSSGKGTHEKRMSQKVGEILSRCTVSIGGEARPDGKTWKEMPDYFLPHWSHASMNDRGFAMIRLRQLSLGDKYIFSANCPRCSKEMKRCVGDLTALKVTNRPLEDISKDAFPFTLPSGAVLQWKFLTGSDQDAVEDILENMPSDYNSGVLCRRIVTVNGQKNFGGISFVKEMSLRDRKSFGNHVDSFEGGVESSIDIVCDKCSCPFSRPIRVGGADFFSPSEIL